MKKNFSLPIKYEQQQFTDDRFLKLKIYVMHDNINLNNSNFSMEAIENAKDSIKNIPILAFVKETDGDSQKDFAGHEMELIFKDDEFTIKYLGRPIGVIPADNNNYHYENIDDKTYVVVDGYVWKDYANDALDILERDGMKSESMEIVLDSFNYTDDGVCDITAYKYTGVTLLGDDVSPAMENAKAEVITTQTFNKNEFKDKISKIMTELKFTLEGGKKMNEEKGFEDQNSDQKEEMSTQDDTTDEKEDLACNPENMSSDQEDNQEKPIDKDMMSADKSEDTKTSTFSFTSEQLEDELSRLLSQEKTKDEWGWEYPCYWYIDHLPDQSVVIAYDCDDSYIVGFNYTVEGDTVTIDMGHEQRYKLEYIPMEISTEVENNVVSNSENFSFAPIDLLNHYKDAKKESESVKTKFSQYKDELTELRKFKADRLAEERQIAENELYTKFSNELTEDEMKPVKEKASEYSLDVLEEKLFAIAGRKKVKFSTNSNKDKRIKMGVFNLEEDKPIKKDIWTEQKEKFGSNN